MHSSALLALSALLFMGATAELEPLKTEPALHKILGSAGRVVEALHQHLDKKPLDAVTFNTAERKLEAAKRDEARRQRGPRNLNDDVAAGRDRRDRKLKETTKKTVSVAVPVKARRDRRPRNLQGHVATQGARRDRKLEAVARPTAAIGRRRERKLTGAATNAQSHARKLHSLLNANAQVAAEKARHFGAIAARLAYFKIKGRKLQNEKKA
eukprot:GHVS01047208.1.p1 GENE.GHVS01047208.1~~GHVS01047208.1.p1  ORF type:complete len:244 (+),score=33.34 GHVS01047208.1:101-733(+)